MNILCNAFIFFSWCHSNAHMVHHTFFRCFLYRDTQTTLNCNKKNVMKKNYLVKHLWKRSIPRDSWCTINFSLMSNHKPSYIQMLTSDKTSLTLLHVLFWNFSPFRVDHKCSTIALIHWVPYQLIFYRILYYISILEYGIYKSNKPKKHLRNNYEYILVNF